MAHCKLCLLPSAAPGADIDHAGICAFCRSTSSIDRAQAERERERRAMDLEETLKACRGRAAYDAVVCLSGGKDSIYLLYKLKVEYGLKVLAFTTDMNIPEVAWDNIRRTVDKLDVEHVVHRPERGFYRRMYRFLLQNQEERGAVRTVCYVCAPLFESDALSLAAEKGIPLVLAGYSPGQPEPDRMVYEFSREMICETDWTPPELRTGDLFSERELERFWNPLRYPKGTAFPRYIAPFHAWPYSQEDNMKKVVELGLIANARSASPVHSNCPLNWLLMYSDLQNLGYNPYAPEFAALIREGKANRMRWRFMIPAVNFMIRHQLLLGRNAKESLKWLGLTSRDLRITRRAGAKQPRTPRQADAA